MGKWTSLSPVWERVAPSRVSHVTCGKSSRLKSIAVEPQESPVISGGKPGAHGIQGIGAGFVPHNLDVGLLDHVETASTEEAYHWARSLARQEGLLGGISTGANVAVAARLAARPENHDKTIVTFACSSGERYLSTPLYDLMGMPPLTAVLAHIRLTNPRDDYVSLRSE